MSTYKIALNSGHGFNTPGKRCLKAIDPNQTREYQLNSRICNLIEEKLKAYKGYELLRLDDTTGKKDIALKTRTDSANKFKANIYLSIHHNAGIKGGSGGGIEAYVYLKVDQATLDYQKAFYNAVIASTGLKGNRAQPLRKADLHECRESNMPCVLLECGFMDSVTDTPKILTADFANKVAEACVKVLVNKGKLSKKEAAPSKPATPIGKKSVAEIAKEVIAGKWGNGSERKARLTAAGYSYAEVQAEVNKQAKASTAAPKKTTDQIAREVIAGKWGSGALRKAKLKAAGYNYSVIQKRVNQMLKGR